MVRNHWIVGDTVVRDEEGPASPVTVVLVTSMEDIRVEEESIPRLHLYLNQWKRLSGDWDTGSQYFVCQDA